MLKENLIYRANPLHSPLQGFEIFGDWISDANRRKDKQKIQIDVGQHLNKEFEVCHPLGRSIPQ